MDVATGVIATLRWAGNQTGYSTACASVLTYEGASCLTAPQGIAIDGEGNLFVSDGRSERIVELTAPQSSADAGMWTTSFAPVTAGTLPGQEANGSFSLGIGDGGAPLNGYVRSPAGLAIDATGNLYVADRGNDRVRIITGVAKGQAAKTPPVITSSISGTVGANGWYTSDVSVTWLVAYNGATPPTKTGCDATLIASDTTAQTFTCTATDEGGTTSKSVTIKRDATPPTAATLVSPFPNSSGWNRTPVAVHFTGTDATSGIASCTPDVSVTIDGESQSSSSGTCADSAGNVSTPVRATGINIDRTLPVATASAAPAPNSAGWNNTAVTVSFSGADDLSGVAANGCTTALTLSSDGASQTASGTCTDRAGNVSAAATVSGVNIDRTPPTAVAVASPPPNAYGWNSSTVTVSFAGTDNLSGSGISRCTDPIAISAGLQNQAASGTCIDRAGNTSAPATALVSIDNRYPVIAINVPVGGALYTVGTIVNASYTCSDEGSGLVSCDGQSAAGSPIDTATLGDKIFPITARDKADNVTSTSLSYRVVARGDVNGDNQVDQRDLTLINTSLNRPASGPYDIRDLNHDGIINALDARMLVTLCTYPGCATH